MLDAMLASGDVINWDRQHRLMLNNRSLPNTNIVDLVAHLLHPHDERIEEPKAFSLFVQALKISNWSRNELVKDMLDDASDSSSDSEDESDDSDDGDDDDNNENDDDDDNNNENDDDDNNNNDENEDDDDGDDNSGDDVDKTIEEPGVMRLRRV